MNVSPCALAHVRLTGGALRPVVVGTLEEVCVDRERSFAVVTVGAVAIVELSPSSARALGEKLLEASEALLRETRPKALGR